jgi:tetratricopeptide (TPR) repeat protein
MHPLLALLALCPTPAHAEGRVPDYRAELAARVTEELERLNVEGRHKEAIRRGEAFGEDLFPAATVAYEVAFAYNRLGRVRPALRTYEAALSLDPGYAAAWYDLGELRLARGELDLAESCFSRSSALRPDHWAGPFRLADLAARRRDSTAFEENFREALRRGFDPLGIVGDATWRDHARDPVIAPVFARLVTVYGNEELLRMFEVPR